MPKLVHSAINVIVINGVVNRINEIVFNFLWAGNDKVKRNTIIGTIDQGGLNMIDVECHFKALKATWVSRILLSEEAETWAFIPKQYLELSCLSKTILEINHISPSLEKCSISKFPVFYQQALLAFCASNTMVEPESKECCLNQTVWGNKLIMNKGNESLYFINWIKSGILHIKDLKIINKNLSEEYILAKLINRSNYVAEIYQMKLATKKF